MTIELEDFTIYEALALKNASEALMGEPQRLELSTEELETLKQWKETIEGLQLGDFNIRSFEVEEYGLMLAVLDDYLQERQSVIEHHGMTYGEKDYRLELANLIDQIRVKKD